MIAVRVRALAGALAEARFGASQPPVFEDVRFLRPVHIPNAATVTVRIAALVRSPGVAEVALRSSETAFQADHFRAVCRFRTAALSGTARPASGETLPIDPDRDLYGSILFQSGRFQRLRAYRRLSATECIAEIAADATGDWFARYLPATLALGDPGARDAFIHCVQACIPHATVLPTGVERIVIAAPDQPGPRYVHARERSANGGRLVYDLEVIDAQGATVERWECLQLQVIGTAARIAVSANPPRPPRARSPSRTRSWCPADDDERTTQPPGHRVLRLRTHPVPIRPSPPPRVFIASWRPQ